MLHLVHNSLGYFEGLRSLSKNEVMNLFAVILIFLFFACCSSDPITEGTVSEIQEVYEDFDQVEKFSGKVINSEWKSDFLNEARSITAYLPPNYNGESEYGVIFVTDNVVIPLAQCVETLIAENEIAPIIIVGINLREIQPGDSIFGDYLFDFRNLEFFKSEEIFVQKRIKREEPSNNGNLSTLEYCSDFQDNPELLVELGFDVIVSNRYEKFTSYLIQEVIPFVKRNYSVSKNTDDWTLGGLSSGGAFVYNFTCDFPNIFGNAIVMSPAGPYDNYDFSKSTSKYFLAGGNHESYLGESLDYIPEFEKLGIPYLHRTYEAGHDWQMWLTFYLESIQIIYKK